ncbi:LysR substrate-binding domain-containing protein [Variovorax sp. E3]|uniref:LysR substrate-binding domain-containing protein n=1 Tax=Variovorax sp. E3 TaxID=1914993 RepID=UPI0018DC684E|nr:LysR substrate-binding domain-containing protein [Variovorax sp. E3]
MDFKQLKYFTEIADFGNMTRAAESLFIAQPALTQQIANLEAELGTRVFDRSTQGVRLTSAGDVLYRHARSLLKQMDDAKAAVIDESDHPSGRVTIGIPGSTGKMLAVPLLKAMSAHERILLEFVERPSAELMTLVSRGRLDVAVVVDAVPCRGVALTRLLMEDLYVIRPAGEVASGRPITLKALAAQPLVLPTAPSTIRQRVDTAFMQFGLRYRLVGEVSATDMLVRLVSAGLGLTVLPWAAVAEEVQQGTVDALQLARHRLRRELAICVSDAVPLNRAADVVRASVIDIVCGLVNSGAWRGVYRVGPA